jgi:FK506-binding protein 4/5
MSDLFGLTPLSTVEIAPGVKKEITKVATGTVLPTRGQDVYVHYTGKLLDGSTFDSSVTRGKPFCFKVGLGMVISAWDLGVATMAVGEECVLTASADHAYGASGSPPVIPPNSTLAFKVECLSIGAPPAGVQAEEESWCQVA